MSSPPYPPLLTRRARLRLLVSSYPSFSAVGVSGGGRVQSDDVSKRVVVAVGIKVEVVVVVAALADSGVEELGGG